MAERASWFELKQRLVKRLEETPRSRKTKRGQTFGKELSEKGSACEVPVSQVACSGGIADSVTSVGPLRPEDLTGIIKLFGKSGTPGSQRAVSSAGWAGSGWMLAASLETSPSSPLPIGSN